SRVVSRPRTLGVGPYDQGGQGRQAQAPTFPADFSQGGVQLLAAVEKVLEHFRGIAQLPGQFGVSDARLRVCQPQAQVSVGCLGKRIHPNLPLVVGQAVPAGRGRPLKRTTTKNTNHANEDKASLVFIRWIRVIRGKTMELIPHRATVLARLGTTVQHVRFRVDQDALVAAAVDACANDPMAPPLLPPGPRAACPGPRPGPGRPVGVAEPTCSSRGASPAACTFMPKSIRLTSTSTCPCGCMSPPMTPKTNHGLPSFVTSEG